MRGVAEIVENVTNMVAEYGDLIKFWLGNKLIVFTNNADYIEQILNAPQSIEKGASYEFMMELTGYGLITMKGSSSVLRKSRVCK